MKENFTSVIDQICEEKGIKKEKVIETIEAALAAAFRKDYGKKGQDVRVKFDEKTGSAKVFQVITVVEDEEFKNEEAEVKLSDAKKKNKKSKIGDETSTEVTPTSPEYGRIAAQTAKQVIIQRIREAEREAIFDDFKDKQGEVINGTVQRLEGRNVFIDLGRSIGILFPAEQIPGEIYQPNQRLKVYIAKVGMGMRGPEVTISRSHPDLLKKLFELEVPEIFNGSVEIKAVAREAGQRSKIAVFSKERGVDPVGSCVGQRGTRVQTVIAELGGEKIDIIPWKENIITFISSSLSPAKVISVKILNEKNKEAEVAVDESQLSLAIGRYGQNVRLAAKLTGWKINIKGAEKAVGVALAPARIATPASNATATAGWQSVAGGATLPDGKKKEVKKENEAVELKPEQKPKKEEKKDVGATLAVALPDRKKSEVKKEETKEEKKETEKPKKEKVNKKKEDKKAEKPKETKK